MTRASNTTTGIQDSLPSAAEAVTAELHPRSTSRPKDKLGWIVWPLATLAVFGVLTVANAGLLYSPPFFDYASAFWLEANWLAENAFDYQRLIYEEPHLFDGGSKAYMISALPSLLAAMMVSTDTPQNAILLYHLFHLLCGSVLAVMIYAELSGQIGPLSAALTTLAAVVCPLYVAQLGMVGMELPMAVFAFATLMALTRERYFTAATCSFLAFAMKASAALVTVALFAYLCFFAALVATRPGSPSRRPVLLGLLATFALVLIELAAMRWSGTVEVQYQGTISSIFDLMMTAFWSPDLVALALLCGAVLVFRFLAQLISDIRRRSGPLTHAMYRSLGGIINEHSGAVFSLILVGGTCIAMSRILAVPRYYVILIPFIYYLVGLALFGSGRRIVPTVAIVVLVCFNALNHSGRFYPAIERAVGPEMAHIGSFQERSLEYLTDHQANIAMCRMLSEKYADVPVVSDFPFSLFLALPRYGYVDEALLVYNLGWFRGFDVRNMRGLLDDAPNQPIVAGINYYGPQEGRDPDNVPGNLLFFDATSPNLVVYRLDTPSTLEERRRQFREMWLPEMDSGTPDDFLQWASRCLHHDLPEDALATLENGLALYPRNPLLHATADAVEEQLAEQSDREKPVRSIDE